MRTEAELKQVLADVLGIAVETIGEQTSMETETAWDSLKHLNLVLALEAAFDLSFTEEQTVEILSYPLIKVALASHGTTFDDG